MVKVTHSHLDRIKNAWRNFVLRHFFQIVVATFSLFLIAVQISHILNFPIWTDDAFFGIVAKNLAGGFGYQATIFDQNYPFHHGISAGPILIVPAAIMIFIFGNQHWVLGATTMILSWALLVTIFFQMRTKISREKIWYVSFFALALTLFFSINSEKYGVYGGDDFVLWYIMFGEVPAALLVILGSMILFSEKIDYKKVGCGSLILGLAILSKTISAIACLVILSSFALRVFLLKEIKFFEKSKLIALAGFSFIAPFFLFELVKIIAMGWQNYHSVATDNKKFYSEVAFVDLERSMLSEKIKYLLRIFEESIAILPLFMASLVAISSRDHFRAARGNSAMYWLGIILVVCGILHMLWWIFFSVFVNERYMISAVFYCAFGMAFLLSEIEFSKDFLRKNFLNFTCATLLFLLIASHFGYFVKTIFHAFDKSDKLQEQLTISRELDALKGKGATLFSCGINYELDYLMNGSGNFLNCKDLPKKISRHKLLLVSDFVEPGKILTSAIGDSFTKILPVPKIVVAKCGEKYLATNGFSLNWCQAKNVTHGSNF